MGGISPGEVVPELCRWEALSGDTAEIIFSLPAKKKAIQSLQ